MILYNGSTGGIGRFMAATLKRRGLDGQALSSRLEDRTGLRKELNTLAPDSDPVLVLLAARVSVPACEADPEGTFRTNVMATADTARDFATWAHQRSLKPRVLYVSTGHVYAEGPAGERAPKSAPTAPRSVYAQSKLRAESALGQLAEDMDFDLTVARVFGLVAPDQPANYLLPGLIRRVRTGQLADIPGLSYVRDYLDARDVCEKLLLLVSPPRGERTDRVIFNVCSGEGVTIREVLGTVIQQYDPAGAQHLMAQATEATGRPDDIVWIVGDPSALVAVTGVGPRAIPLEQTVRDALAVN